MKRMMKKVIAASLTLIMIFSCFVGCSTKGETLMEIDGTKMSVNIFQLYLSRTKGLLYSAQTSGDDALDDSSWDTVMDKDGTTYNEYFTSLVFNNTKTNLAAIYEFEQRGLKLPKATLDKIDAKIDEFIENDASGSKTTFNSMLSEYGVNYNMLREAYIIEEKIAYLKNVIYGANGELIAEDLYNDYYKNNYVRFKQLFFATYDYVYITDSNEDDIYYVSEKSKEIAYDTTATPKVDANGKPVYDTNGARVYVTIGEDGKERIAYDTKNGVRRNLTDDDGSFVIRMLDDEELKKIDDTVTEYMSKVSEKDHEGFDDLVGHDEDAPNGYYVTSDSNINAPKVIEALFEMKDGEIRSVPSDYGVHIIMRYELEPDGYADIDNSDFFIDVKTGNFVFLDKMKTQLLQNYLKKHIDKIIVDDAVLDGVTMKTVGANFYY